MSESNLNRQLAALHSTLGQPKAEVMVRRVRDINPHRQAEAFRTFYLPQNADTVDLAKYDYVVDCIDTVIAKLELVTRCNTLQVKIISAMGTGNKFDPSALMVTDISKTQGCPLARTMRKELRKRGINHLKVVCSAELPTSPLRSADCEAPEDTGRPSGYAGVHALCPRRRRPADSLRSSSGAGRILKYHTARRLYAFPFFGDTISVL